MREEIINLKICGYCTGDTLLVLRQRADPLSYTTKAPQINLCGAFAL
jgi:hypothetical protein